ncbi:glycosidase [Balneicella halophila]|uniref:Glycosidase n=1 Tax=Balneicella halophila TaxID=1537566 RepID=A0A7L4US49_BALHA|nr:alpha-amylase family glycosyl hydrolase [Balneicella halophila]PVX51774.1 glycosidase [Balneicella halophila]
MKKLKLVWLLALSALFLFSACKKKQEAVIQTDTGADENYIATRSTNHVDWAKDAVIYEVNVRQYTKEGTFKAFEEHLPRLKELGVDILWLMPISPISEKNRKGEMGSYYSVQDYKKVNPEFGTEEDFKAIIEKAHELGMHVILDWVANHTGWDNPWITENPEWYTKDENGKIIPPNPDWTDVADLNYYNVEMRAAMIDALEYWVKEFNVDGYRCDVAGEVPVDFWNDARKALDEIKPVFMLAEAWEPQLSEDAFDMVYGWESHHIMNEVAKGNKTAVALHDIIVKDANRYHEDTYIMQFITNHDENSWNGTEFERMGDAVKTFATLTFTMPGMPLIYSGQEAGLDKRLAFFKKDEISWEDMKLTDFYKKLTALKHDNEALWNGNSGGKYMAISDSPKDVLAFSREKNNNKVVCLFNFSDEEQTYNGNDFKLNGIYTEYFSDEKLNFKENSSILLKPWEYKVFIKK